MRVSSVHGSMPEYIEENHRFVHTKTSRRLSNRHFAMNISRVASRTRGSAVETTGDTSHCPGIQKEKGMLCSSANIKRTRLLLGNNKNLVYL